jgi:serine phosphatase RsbU (regulator of sigma subunit)/anti-sigma regulatory factor (Ser/Thr protein kinase)/anti-anti-sigma regulatory factor
VSDNTSGEPRPGLAGDAQVVRALFEDLPELLVGVEGDDRLIVAANSAWRRAARRHRVLGLPLGDAFPGLEHPRLREVYAAVGRTGTPQTVTDCPLRLDAGTGTDDLYVDLLVSPRRAADGRVTGLTLRGVDVTERAHRRHRLRGAEPPHPAGPAEPDGDARALLRSVQGTLLPDHLPCLPDVRLGARYLLAAQQEAAGGDWFDAVPLPGGQLALVVGDVVGHGAAAAAVMGQVRAVLRRNLLDGRSALDCLDTADRLARDVPGAAATTVAVAVLNRTTGRLQCTSAGHPAPLVVGPDGSCRYLPQHGSSPLGTTGDFEVGEHRLEEDELLLLYTDGALERPGVGPARAVVDLAEAARAAVLEESSDPGGRPDRVCHRILHRLTEATGYRDDITLLAAERRAPPLPLQVRLPVAPGTLAAARTELAMWLFDFDADTADEADLHHAVCELVTNAMEHGYRDGPVGTVRIDAVLTGDGRVVVTVADSGRWRPPSADPAMRGFGLAIARAMTDSLRIRHDALGTEVTVSRRLRLPTVVVLDAPEPAEAADAARLPVDQASEAHTEADGDGARVRLTGRLDAATALSCEHQLRVALGAGTVPAVIDLSAVTLLASAGVQTLHRIAADARAHSTDLRLFAPARSTAHHVLTLVRLPHETSDPARDEPDDPRASADGG